MKHTNAIEARREAQIKLAFAALKHPGILPGSAHDIANALRAVGKECLDLVLKYDKDSQALAIAVATREKERYEKKRERAAMYKEEAETRKRRGLCNNAQTASVMFTNSLKALKEYARDEAYHEIFETLKLRGKPIGNVWHHELESYRKDGAFEAAICEMLLNHAQPAEDCQIRDFVSPDVLVGMVNTAKAKADFREQKAA